MRNVNLTKLLRALGVLVLGIIVLILFNTVFRKQLIIAFGVRSMKYFRGLGIMIILLGGILAIRYTVPIVILYYVQELHSKLIRQFISNPNRENAKAALLQLSQDKPWSKKILKKGLNQLENIDKSMMCQQLLIENNDATYLRNTLPVLEKIEHEVCKNFIPIVNMCMIVDDVKHVNQGEIDEQLWKNAELIERINALMKLSTKLIDQYNEEGNVKSLDLIDSWIKATEQKLEEG